MLSLRVWSLCSATREAAIVRGPRTAMKSGPHLPQLEKALAQKRRPNTAINKKTKKQKNKKTKKLLTTSSIDKDGWQGECSYIAGGDAKWYSQSAKSFVSF